MLMTISNRPLVYAIRNTLISIFSACSEYFLSLPSKHLLFKVSNRNSRKRLEICSKLKIKIPERRH